MRLNLERYHRPKSLSRAVALLGERPGRSAILAGGTKLIDCDSKGITDVIDILHMGLGGVQVRGRYLRIGATTSVQDLMESESATAWSSGLLSEACRIASSSILLRNMSTAAGEIAGAGSQASLVAALLALDARLSIFDGAKRSMSLEEYLAQRRAGPLGPHVIKEIDVPKPARLFRAKMERLAQLPSSLSLALVVVGLELRRKGCARPRIAVSGATPFPVLVPAAQSVIDGKELTTGAILDCAEAVAREVECFADQHASAEYRREMVGVLVRRALTELSLGNRAGDR